MTYEYSCQKFILAVMAVQSLTNHKVDSAISLSDLQLLIFPNYVAFAICRAHLPAHLHAVCYRA